MVFEAGAEKIDSYAYINAEKTSGTLKKMPTQQARNPARLIRPQTIINPNTCQKCLPTILRLAPMAVQKSRPLSTTSGSVSIQLTSTDGLGAIGRGEGIAAQAVVLLAAEGGGS